MFHGCSFRLPLSLARLLWLQVTLAICSQRRECWLLFERASNNLTHAVWCALRCGFRRCLSYYFLLTARLSEQEKFTMRIFMMVFFCNITLYFFYSERALLRVPLREWLHLTVWLRMKHGQCLICIINLPHFHWPFYDFGGERGGGDIKLWWVKSNSGRWEKLT